MSQFIYDSLELSYDKYTDNELKSEIEEQLGEEHLASVLNTIKEEVWQQSTIKQSII